eukprot:scaffold64_cov150-Amphora_coffeaeformis.AAC.12
MTRDSVVETKRSESHSPIPRLARLKQKTGHLFRAHSPSSTPQRATKEESHTVVEKEVSDIVKGLATGTAPTRSKSLSPMPRLNRLKQKSAYAFLKARSPSPSQSSTTMGLSVNMDNAVAGNDQTEKPNSRDDSLHPIPRLNRLKQLPGFEKMKARAMSPISPSVETELETVIFTADKETQVGNNSPTPPPLIKPQSRTGSLSPVPIRKVFDPIGSRSPPLPRPKGSSSLSPIPRPKAVRSIKTDGLARDPPARLQVPDISTSPKHNETDAPRDPDAITPRGSSPRAGIGFAFDEVDRRLSDDKAAQSEKGARSDESLKDADTLLKVPFAGHYASDVLANELEYCSSPANSVISAGSFERRSQSLVLDVPDEKREEIVQPAYLSSPIKSPSQLVSPDEVNARVSLPVASATRNRAAMETESISKMDTGTITHVDTDVADSAIAKSDGSAADGDRTAAETAATENCRDAETSDHIGELAEATCGISGKVNDITAKSGDNTPSDDVEMNEQLGAGEEEMDSERGYQSAEPHECASDENDVSADLEDHSADNSSVPKADPQDSLYNEYLLSVDAGDDLASSQSEEREVNHVEAMLNPPVAFTSGEDFSTENLDNNVDGSCGYSMEDTATGSGVAMSVSAEDALVNCASSSPPILDRPSRSGREIKETVDCSNCPTDTSPSNDFNEMVREEEHDFLTQCSTEEIRNTSHSSVVHGSIDSKLRQPDKQEKSANIVQYESFAAIKGGASYDSCSYEGSGMGYDDPDPPKQEQGNKDETEIMSQSITEDSPQAEREDTSENDSTASDHVASFTEQSRESGENASPLSEDFDDRGQNDLHGQPSTSEGADPLSIQNGVEQPYDSHEISCADLDKLRDVAGASSMFDETSSVANTESTFTAADGAGMTVPRANWLEFIKSVQPTPSLGPVEDCPEQSTRATSDSASDGPSDSGPGDRVKCFEVIPPPPPLLQKDSLSQLHTDLTREVTAVQQAHFLLMPPPPPPGGKRIKKKKRSTKGKVARVAKQEDSSNTESKLEVSSEESEDEDLAIFIDSLDRDAGKKNDAEADGIEVPRERVVNSAEKHAENVIVVETVTSNDSCASPRRTQSFGDSESNIQMSIRADEDCFHVPTSTSGTSFGPAEREAFVGATGETIHKPPPRINVVSSDSTDRTCRGISPVSSSKILHDSKLAEKVDTAISIAAERLEKRAPDAKHHPVNEPGSIVDLPTEPSSTPIKLQRSTRFDTSKKPHHKENTSKRYLVPEGRPSPFEAIVYLKPAVIGQILDFLGGKFRI